MTTAELLLQEAEEALFAAAQSNLRSLEAVYKERCWVDLSFGDAAADEVPLSLDRADLFRLVRACEAKAEAMEHLTAQLQEEWTVVRLSSSPQHRPHTTCATAAAGAARVSRLKQRLNELLTVHSEYEELCAAALTSQQEELDKLQTLFQTSCTAYGTVQEAVVSAANQCAALQRRLRQQCEESSRGAASPVPQTRMAEGYRCRALTQRLWDAYHRYTAAPLGEFSSPLSSLESGRSANEGRSASPPGFARPTSSSFQSVLQDLQRRADVLLTHQWRDEALLMDSLELPRRATTATSHTSSRGEKEKKKAAAAHPSLSIQSGVVDGNDEQSNTAPSLHRASTPMRPSDERTAEKRIVSTAMQTQTLEAEPCVSPSTDKREYPTPTLHDADAWRLRLDAVRQRLSRSLESGAQPLSIVADGTMSGQRKISWRGVRGVDRPASALWEGVVQTEKTTTRALASLHLDRMRDAAARVVEVELSASSLASTPTSSTAVDEEVHEPKRSECCNEVSVPMLTKEVRDVSRGGGISSLSQMSAHSQRVAFAHSREQIVSEKSLQCMRQQIKASLSNLLDAKHLL